MKKIFVLISLFFATAAYAEAPSDMKIILAILKDSAVHNMTNVSLTLKQYNEPGKFNEYSLSITTHNANYRCSWVIVDREKKQIRSGEYLVQAQVGDCVDSRGISKALQNDYTSSEGISIFRDRIFFDNNTKFRKLESDESAFDSLN